MVLTEKTPGSDADLLLQVFAEPLVDRRPVVEVDLRQRHLHHQDVLRIEPRIDAEQPRHARDHEAGAREDHQGERHLRSHERVAEPAPAALRRPAGRVLQGLVEVAAEGRDGRREAEQDAREARDAEREREHHAVHPDLAQGPQGHRLEVAGQERRQEARGPDRDHQARSTAQQAQEHALRQQLADDSPATRAHRAAHGQLLVAHRRARQHQVRHVHARDQQHEAHDAQERQQRRPHPGDAHFVHRLEPHRPPADLTRVLIAHPPPDRVHLGPRLGQRHARLHPSESHERVRPPRLIALGEPHRHPQLPRSAPELERERRRHHPHHREVRPVDLDRLADQRRIRPVAPRPEPVAQHHHLVPPRRLLFGQEGPPQHRTHTQGREEARRDPHAGDLLGLAPAPQVVAPPRRIEERHALERAALLPKIPKVRPRDDVEIGGIGDRPLPDHHQPFRLRKRNRPQERRIHHPEHRGIGPDAQRQRHHRHRRETRIPPKHPQRVPDVAQDRVHAEPPRGSAKATLVPPCNCLVLRAGAPGRGPTTGTRYGRSRSGRAPRLRDGETPRTSSPKRREARARLRSWVAMAGDWRMRSCQTRAVAK